MSQPETDPQHAASRTVNDLSAEQAAEPRWPGERDPLGGGASSAAYELRQCAEHALLEMRDRFDLKRGDSISLDALEDALGRCLPVVGLHFFSEPPVPPPHGNTICSGCEACKIRAAKGLPLYA